MRPHDTLRTLRDLGAGTPLVFVLAARALPAGILGQFLLAGLALFGEGGSWVGHAILGSTLILPVGVVLASALLVRRLRGFIWWAGLVGLLYAVQVALGAGRVPMALALHPLNGALLLTASLVLLAKVERRVGAAANGSPTGVPDSSGAMREASLPPHPSHRARLFLTRRGPT